MAQLLSHSHVELEIGGHTFEGYADEDRPVEFGENGEDFNLSFGRDGGMYGTSNVQLGQVITVRLAPTSPSAQWCVQQRQLRNDALVDGGDIPIYDGNYSDSVQGRSAVLQGGVMTCPAMMEPGVTFEAMFTFERVTSDVDGATFTPTLESGATA